MTAGALARLVRDAAGRRAEEAADRCELCRAVLDGEHRHLLDTARQELLCACRACALLFADRAAGGGAYRLVPRRRVRLPAVATRALGVPVGLAFFVTGREEGQGQGQEKVTAHYPGPAGAVRWEADPVAWREAVAGVPRLATLEHDVEALLVNTARGLRHHWIVPVDDCFRVVALVRREWRGLSGGDRVWPAVERFFGGLTERDP
ncbi:hypothetical protein GCM10010218_61300 [Streptomyces mashuensis]|uniref:Uncharacterized protein n=1 Tax=Streptomyces mashuensis TaxID=33904 RepID=A0A919B8I2_9ACTN|nr:DUF5947 family protein [Streptomyces mashuensis]GHF71808.1 hypothetical protein GCM10010218_61300 [Streptomyces mashuensis]